MNKNLFFSITNINLSQNLVIQYTAFKVIDNELRLNIDTQGGGDAIVCQDGFCFKAIWKKNSTNSRTRYYHDLGEEEFLFNPGITWVEVVNETYKPNGIYNQIN